MNRHRDWLEQALRDLEKARIDQQHQYWEWACFTAQQSAEKAVKALLISLGLDAWGHAITPMLKGLTSLSVPLELVEKAQLLDAYYIQTLCPNGFSEGKPADYFNATKAQEAIHAAEAINQFCKDYIDRPDQSSGGST